MLKPPQVSNLEQIPWANVIAWIKAMIAQYGPAAVPMIEGYIAALPIPIWAKMLLDALVESLLNPPKPA